MINLGNILISIKPDGHYIVKLADFGLSRATSAPLLQATPQVNVVITIDGYHDVPRAVKSQL